MAGDIDIEASGLLGGLDGDACDDRAALIRWLLDRGFDVERIRGEPSPMLLPANRVLGDNGLQVSEREISADTGFDLELVQRLLRAVGLPRVDDPDAAVLLRADGEAAAEAAKVLFDLGFDPAEVVSTVRVLADGLHNAVELMREATLKAIMRPGTTELELAQAFEARSLKATPLVWPMIEGLFRLQVRHTFESEAIDATERAAGAIPGSRQTVVAIADLVGFTELGEVLPPENLEHVASRLTDLARDVATPPVRFVKTIGDAVMLVCPDPAPLLNAVLTLVAAAATAEDFPRLRVGVASGLAVSRAGDWYGSPVNVASRVTSAARPGEVLVAEVTRQEIGDAKGFVWSSAGLHQFKGVSDNMQLFLARRTCGEKG